ncbi:replication initiator protein [Capybara microvirus Cap3_SP_457]|nr:replication initiator protein [Capybara microvirus Cap3_SP_457]
MLGRCVYSHICEVLFLACFHPRLCQRVVDCETGELKVFYIGWEAQQTLIHGAEPFQYSFDHQSDQAGYFCVPCGKCIGCRLDYSRHWADRCLVEFDHTKKGLFLTLTYDDLHLPITKLGSPTLRYRDVQLFNKSLRQFMQRELHLTDLLRFYCAGEYGTHGLRPHYHMIAFGISVSDLPDLVLARRSKHGLPLYESKSITDIWSRGFVQIGSVSWQSCAYVARYSAKKLSHVAGDGDPDVVKEFSKMSLKPGLGGYFLEDHPEYKDQFLNSQYKIYLSDDPAALKKVKSVRPPKYILNELAKIYPQEVDEYRQKMIELGYSKLEAELSQTDLLEDEYQTVKEVKKEHDFKKLLRSDF